jgi:hypothetical protein
MHASGSGDPLLIESFRFGNSTWNVKITLLSPESSLRILLAIAAAKEEMAELTPSSVKSLLVEWCHASGPKARYMVLDPNCCTFAGAVANLEMSCHPTWDLSMGMLYFPRGVGVIVHRQVIVKNASNNKLQFRGTAER